MTPDEERVDAGLAYLPGVSGPISPVFCGRENCGSMALLGHDFCEPCLAWLRGDLDVDPIAAQEKAKPARHSSLAPGPYPPGEVDDEEWYEYLATARARYG